MIQINLNNKWLSVAKYFVFAIIFHFILGWFGGCSSGQKNDAVQKIVIPAVTGKFESKKPESKLLVIKQDPVSESKKDEVRVYSKVVENPLIEQLTKENEKLKSDYLKMSDSLKPKAYDKAIELNRFSSVFEDKFTKLTISGIVRGEVQEITPEYTLKQREGEATVKGTKLRVLLGGSIGINKDFNQGVYRLDLNLQNKKGDIISGEYLRVNNQNYGMIGFKKSILNIKM